MNKFNIVGIFLFLPILCSKSRKVGVITSSLESDPPAPNFKTISFLPSKEANNRTGIRTETRYASHKQTNPGKLGWIVYCPFILLYFLYL